ncbi:cell wall-binding repeat-containing protein [Romboutsia sp.]|uniref:cell wall-binding repeat-containing protein n=1 Tax=Romboutsia sp. TaxID=1965302 RepID=UPI003F676B43
MDKNIIAGNTPTETAIEISKNWQQSEEVVLVNSKAKSDLLCATVLASQINCPILLAEENKLLNITTEEINRLQPKTIYIIGGQDIISQKVEEQLNNYPNVQRISGKDRYKTSIEVANIINSKKASPSVIIVNGHYSVADTISIAPAAGNKNIPIIISKQQDLEEGKEWIENNNIETAYIIGGKNVISENIENQLVNSKRIGGNNRYDTNAKVIEEFYNGNDIETLFYCKGSEEEEQLIEGMIATPFLATKNSPIALVGNSLSAYQKEVLTKKNINNLVQVGYDVNEEVKEELNSLKKNTPPTDTKPSEPVKPPEPIKPPEDKEAPKIIENTVDEYKKIITITFNEDIYSNVTNPKENITLEAEGKTIKLNKYDKVIIKENKLIIELEDGLLATSNNILIKANTIMDKNKNYTTEPIELKGLGKIIVFIKDDTQLQTYVSGKKKADIIKLENNIQLVSSSEIYVKVDDLTIDGSNGENNYKIEGVNKKVDYKLNIFKDNVTIRNLDLDYVSINVIDRKGVKFKNLNMNINVNKINTPAIILDHSTAEGIDLILQSPYTGVLITSSMPQTLSSRANLIINGTIQNATGTSIILSNTITEVPATNLNTVSTGINIKDINELYNIETKKDNKQEYKIYTNKALTQ